MLNELKKNGLHAYGQFFPERLVPLHSMLANCGYQNYTANYVWDSLKRGPKPMMIWQYTVSGRGAFRFGNQICDLEPGTAFIAEVPGNNCYYLPDDSDHWELLYVTIIGTEAIRLMRELVEKNGAVFTHPEDCKTIDLFCEIYRTYQKGKIDNPFKASELAYRFIMTLYDEILLGNWKKARPEFIGKVIDYCMEHTGESLEVEDMAEISGLSRYHFTREFKKYTGMTPMAYYTEMRVKKAIRMLQAENKTIKEIAFECGYEDLSYFGKIFRKSTGMSPASFRDTEK